MGLFGNSTSFNQKLGVKDKILMVVLLSLTAFYCTLPLFIFQGLPHSHDIIFHLFYADRFKQALDEGLIYPRWILDANNGYGGPHFIFYSPLSYYFFAAVNFIIPSAVVSMIVAIWSSFFLSGVAMYFALIRRTSKMICLLTAIGYQIMPFHIIDLYERGTFAELFAFIWFPLTISFMLRINERRNRTAVVGLAVSYAGLIMTHLVSAFMVTFIIGMYFIYHFVKVKDIMSSFRIIYAIVLGIGISALYLMPVIFERKFVHIEYLLSCSVCDYTNNFLFTQEKLEILKQFFFRLHAGVVIEVILFIILIIFIASNRRLLHNINRTFFIFLFIGSFLLATPLSKPLWAVIPFFPTLQFPWRWIFIMEGCLCLLMGNMFQEEISPQLNKPYFAKRMTLYIVLILSVFSSIMIFETPVFREGFLIETIHSEQIKKYLTPTIEYMPRSINIRKFTAEGNHKKVSVISGSGQYDIKEWKSEKRTIQVKASTPVKLRIATFHYPGWIAEINSNETPVKVEENLGAMLIDMPKGDHLLVLRFKDTILRRVAKLISIGACLIGGLILIIDKLLIKNDALIVSNHEL